ncbi:hypothetical protein MKX01_037843 [Papaver californicum]|nr:hypothetical protein MKX01_037843 [Papaver californicum]
MAVEATLDEKKWSMPLCVFFKDARCIFLYIWFAIPAALAEMADHIASLIDCCIAVFNQVSRIAIFPLVSITTSFVAEEDAVSRLETEGKLEAGNMEKACLEDSEVKELIPKAADAGNTANKYDNYKAPKLENEKRHIPSASSALVIGGILGLVQAVFLIFGAKPLLGIMGIKHGSPMLAPAQQYLILRSLGAPAILLSLAMEGIFREFKDTTTPLYATGKITKLMEKIDPLPPNLGELQFSRFFKNGVLLLARVIAATFCVTLAASMAARHGPTTMATFQICLQIRFSCSFIVGFKGFKLLQAILATAFAEKDIEKATSIASRVLQLGLVMSLILSVFLGVGLHFGSRLFTNDRNVLRLISIATPFVTATQPINTLAFVFYSIALTIYMSLRMFAGFWSLHLLTFRTLCFLHFLLSELQLGVDHGISSEVDFATSILWDMGMC